MKCTKLYVFALYVHRCCLHGQFYPLIVVSTCVTKICAMVNTISAYFHDRSRMLAIRPYHVSDTPTPSHPIHPLFQNSGFMSLGLFIFEIHIEKPAVAVHTSLWKFIRSYLLNITYSSTCTVHRSFLVLMINFF